MKLPQVHLKEPRLHVYWAISRSKRLKVGAFLGQYSCPIGQSWYGGVKECLDTKNKEKVILVPVCSFSI